MGLMDKLRQWTSIEDDYEDDEFGEYTQPQQREERAASGGGAATYTTSASGYGQSQSQSQSSYANTSSGYGQSQGSSGYIRNNKVVNINTTTQLQVVLVKPDRFDNATEIADHLRDKRTVVINLEQTNKDVARRLLDFLSGATYAHQGNIKKVANATFIIMPYNVGIMGDIIDELESNGLYF